MGHHETTKAHFLHGPQLIGKDVLFSILSTLDHMALSFSELSLATGTAKFRNFFVGIIPQISWKTNIAQASYIFQVPMIPCTVLTIQP